MAKGVFYIVQTVIGMNTVYLVDWNITTTKEGTIRNYTWNADKKQARRYTNLTEARAAASRAHGAKVMKAEKKSRTAGKETAEE